MRQTMEEFAIDRLGAQGDGVTEEGVYVPFALPGERVRAARLGDRARLEEVLVAAPQRIDPVCPHFMACGGCSVQHGSDHLIAAWKESLVAAALAARGIEGVEIRPIRTSPPRSRRRITVTARRVRSGTRIGFHAGGSREIVPIEACPVADPRLVEAAGRLEEIVATGASRKGEIRVTLTASRAGVDAAVEGGKELTAPGLALLAGKAARASLARLSWGGEVAVTIKPPYQWFGDVKVLPPPGGFLQPTAEGEAALQAAVGEAVSGARRVVDLFAGSGTFALPLAREAEVLAAEGEAEAVAALDAGWRAAEGLKEVTAIRRDLFARPLRPADLKGIEAAVIDPPRAGARAQTAELAKARIPSIAAVSCAPATFARDARALLDAGYTLDWVQPVDQFRWSPHVELVAAFRLA